MKEKPGKCSKPFWEPCQRHPVDCETCQKRDVCQFREDLQKHLDIIKRCRFYEPT